jgi:hypothetical protein
MAQPNNIVQVVPNKDCEVFDTEAVSLGENYFPSNPNENLSNQVETNWVNYAGDTAQKLVAYNLKTLQFRFNGAPSDITKVSRNIAPIKGPIQRNNISQGDFAFDWNAWSDKDSVKFRRDDSSQTFDMATLFPDFASYFAQWKSRFTGYFDASGAPTVAGESSLTQITLWKAQIGLVTFNGYSPLFVSSTEFLQNELFVFGDNVLYYLKDNTSATRKQDRRGSKIFCRIERDNYTVEYEVCNTGTPMKFLEFGYFSKPHQFVVCRGDNCSRYTFISAPYNPVIVEEIASVETELVNFSYQQAIFTSQTDEEVIASSSLVDFSYETAAREVLIQEEVISSAALQTLIYVQSVYDADAGIDTATGEAILHAFEYVFDPPPPTQPPTPATAPTEAAEGVYTIQSLVYEGPPPNDQSNSEAAEGSFQIQSLVYETPPSELDLNEYGDAAIIWAPEDYSSGSIPNSASVPLDNSSIAGTATLTNTTDLGTVTRPTLVVASGTADAFNVSGLTGITVDGGFTIACAINTPETASPVAFWDDPAEGSGDLAIFSSSGGGYSQARLNYFDSLDMVFYSLTATKLSAPAGEPHIIVGYFSPSEVRIWVDGVEGSAATSNTIPDFTVDRFVVGERFAEIGLSIGHTAVYRGLADISDLNTALKTFYGIS